MTRLEQLRVDANLTRQQLSQRTGVAPITITRIEAGKGAIAPPLARLSTFFGVPASDLVRPALPITELGSTVT